MSKKINFHACERAAVLLRSITVMMCRYAVVRTELLCSIIQERCLPFPGSSKEGLGDKQIWVTCQMSGRSFTFILTEFVRVLLGALFYLCNYLFFSDVLLK